MDGYRVGDAYRQGNTGIPPKPSRAIPRDQDDEPARGSQETLPNDQIPQQVTMRAYDDFVFPDPNLPTGKGLQFDYAVQLNNMGVDWGEAILTGKVRLPAWVGRGPR